VRGLEEAGSPEGHTPPPSVSGEMALNGLVAHRDGKLRVDHAEHRDMLVQFRPVYADSTAHEFPPGALLGCSIGENGEEVQGHGVPGPIL
jgi:hypothetical protein